MTNSFDDDENPMFILLKQAEVLQHNNTPKEKTSDPLLVFDGKNEDDESSDAPIGLSFRQPSFSHLTGNPIPKGGTENIENPISIKEDESEKESQTIQIDSDQNGPINISLHHRQSSYANLRLGSTDQAIEIEPAIEENENENPVIVLTKEEENDQPIGLSIRQPSFSSLQGHIIPKGGIESTICQIQEIPEDTEKGLKNSQNDEGSNNLGLQVRQSSYAHLKLNTGSDDPLDHLPATIKEEESNIKQNDPIIVLVDDDENDDGNQPIGLSVRQPSFSSLGQTVIPKGGVESASNLPVLQEENEHSHRESQSLKSNTKQSSYAHLKLPIPSEEDIEEMKNAHFIEDIKSDNNPIIVLTAEDDDDQKNDDESNAPIGLSVRQPSFSSLGQTVIPKGGIEAATMPLIIEENSEESKKIVPQEENEQPLGLQVRQSSYSHLHVGPSNPQHQTPFEPIPEEGKSVSKDDNPVIVLTNEDENDENAENKQIGLSVRQPSFSSLHGSIIPKGGFESLDVPLIEIQEDYTSDESEEDKAPPTTKDKILSSLLDINKAWWQEIGYQLQEDKTYQRNCSMFNLPRCQRDFMNIGNSNTSCFENTKHAASVYHLSLITKKPDEKNSLIRVNSFEHKSQIIKVEMPEREDDDDDAIDTDIMIEDDENEQDTISKMVNGSAIVRVNSHGNESTLKVVEMPIDQNSKQPKKAGNKSLKENRQLSMVRVNSFGNATQELVVEMPVIDDDDYNVSSNDSENDDYDNGVPENILELMSKPINSIVYDALNGESIKDCKRQSISNALTEMKALKKKCDEKGYSDESEYIDQVMNRVKSESSDNVAFFQLDEEIYDAESEFQESLADWQKQYENLDSEFQQKLEECEYKYKEELTKLDEEFRPTITDTQKVVFTKPKVTASTSLAMTSPTSQKTQKRTSSLVTPKQYQPSASINLSPSCLKMKKDIKQLIEAQKYQESGELSLKLHRKEMIAHQKQAKKRSQAYSTAKANLWQKHQDEKNKIINEFESKRLTLSKEREESLGTLRNQFVQLKKMKTMLEENERNQKFIESNQARLRTKSRNQRITNERMTATLI